MGAFEIIEENAGMAPMGSFTPRADQSKFRSVFACVGGTRQNGWLDGNAVQGGITTQDGKARIRYTEYKSPEKTVNRFKHGSMDLQEFVAPIEDCVFKERHDASISIDKCAQYLTARSEKPDASNGGVGRSNEGTIQDIPASQAS